MDNPSQPSTDNSFQLTLDNTHMSATRTLLSLVRTGAAIAGGGALVTDLLVKGWPRWVVVMLASAFVILGYSLMWSALKTGRKLRMRLERQQASEAFLIPLRGVTVWTVTLQLLIVTVLVLYLIG
ncbi:DUF202 domain-containing protein [Vitiosangium sp. GDMCC 1.1324]|uniref:DUF202 domain-containing protein n=1 Tax=Vitiosangium sp. (strain GDMCC 1.1324) TaxID=2138576 RepID=UPI000D3A20F2|nr:DUF202 domain-containing protein [Vitiosangium sp. GDMCC 1.1324]PTL78121.1 hypothetical protein DAT35_41650 [Vitiosangium sp. GDMCC 1.1324]